MLVLSFRSMSARIAKVAVLGSEQRRPLGSNILHTSSHCWVPGTKPYCRQAKIFRSASVSGVCSTVSGMPSSVLVSRSLVQQDKSNARPTTARFLFPVPKKRAKQGFLRLRNYNTFAKSRHFAPHGSFILCVQFSSVSRR